MTSSFFHFVCSSFISFLSKSVYIQWQKVVIPSLRWYIWLHTLLLMFVSMPDSYHPIGAFINLSCKYLFVISGHMLYVILYMFLLVWRVSYISLLAIHMWCCISMSTSIMGFLHLSTIWFKSFQQLSWKPWSFEWIMYF